MIAPRPGVVELMLCDLNSVDQTKTKFADTAPLAYVQHDLQRQGTRVVLANLGKEEFNGLPRPKRARHT